MLPAHSFVVLDSAVRARYDRIASEAFAAWLDERVFRITADSPYRHQAIKTLNLTSGAHVLDLACGTGLNFKQLQAAVGKTGSITGVDISPVSLQVATERTLQNGWSNIELINTAIADFHPPALFDAALCSFAMCIIPDYQGAIDTLFAALKPGGRLTILCMKPSSHPLYRRFNPAWVWMNSRYSGGDVTRDITAYVGTTYGAYQYSECFGGFYYILSATKI
jgi:ubiquinone/menaquinone biosynthesis C-methylase UbiE